MSRKFRWTLEGTFPAGNIEPAFVKVNARPNIKFEEEMNFLSEKSYQPTGDKWETITTTFIDYVTKDDDPLWKVLAACYDFSQVKEGETAQPKEEAKGELKLKLLTPYYKYDKTTPEQIEKNKEMNEKLKADGKRPVMGIGLLGGFGMGQTFSHWEPLEEWTLKRVWPTQINFGELDFSSSECTTIEITWRYSEVLYKSCTPCTTLPCTPSEPKKD
jgi:hypothetical protein